MKKSLCVQCTFTNNCDAIYFMDVGHLFTILHSYRYVDIILHSYGCVERNPISGLHQLPI